VGVSAHARAPWGSREVCVGRGERGRHPPPVLAALHALCPAYPHYLSDQVTVTHMPGAGPALLMQILDTGPGLQGRDYRQLFDPTCEFGGCLERHSGVPTVPRAWCGGHGAATQSMT
jgi:hypothetical protein